MSLRHLETKRIRGPLYITLGQPERSRRNAEWVCHDFLITSITTVCNIYIYILCIIILISSTLHCRGKNGRSKKIGQTNQKMIHFVPNMYVSGKISALWPGTQTVMIFGTTKKIRKLPKTTRFQDLRVFACFCGFLRAFCGFFAGFCGFYPQSFDALQTFFCLCFTKPKNMQSKS